MVGLGNLTPILVGSSLYKSGSQVEASSGNPATYLELRPLGSLVSDFYLFHLFDALMKYKLGHLEPWCSRHSLYDDSWDFLWILTRFPPLSGLETLHFCV